MSDKVAPAVATTEANSLVRSCPSSRQTMQQVLDTSSTPRKAIAAEVLGRDDESQFSKMVGGTRPFDLDHLDRMPRAERVDFLIRRCELEGLEVRDPDIVQVAYEVVDLFDQIAAAARRMRLLPRRAGHMAPPTTFVVEQRQRA
jgi:hypothetical protein